MTRRWRAALLGAAMLPMLVLPQHSVSAQSAPITISITVTAGGRVTTITDKPATIEVPMQTEVTYTAMAAGNVASLGAWVVMFWNEQTNQPGPAEYNPKVSVSRSQGPLLVDYTLVYSARVQGQINSKGPVATTAPVTIHWVKTAATTSATPTVAAGGTAAKPAAPVGSPTVAVASVGASATPSRSDTVGQPPTASTTSATSEGPTPEEIAIASGLILLLLSGGLTVRRVLGRKPVRAGSTATSTAPVPAPVIPPPSAREGLPSSQSVQQALSQPSTPGDPCAAHLLRVQTASARARLLNQHLQAARAAEAALANQHEEARFTGYTSGLIDVAGLATSVVGKMGRALWTTERASMKLIETGAKGLLKNALREYVRSATTEGERQTRATTVINIVGKTTQGVEKSAYKMLFEEWLAEQFARGAAWTRMSTGLMEHVESTGRREIVDTVLEGVEETAKAQAKALMGALETTTSVFDAYALVSGLPDSVAKLDALRAQLGRAMDHRLALESQFEDALSELEVSRAIYESCRKMAAGL